MKKLSLLLTLAIVPAYAFAQMAYWIVQPKYDQIEMALDNTLLKSDSLGITTIWTKDGQRLYTTEDIVNPFTEDKAVVSQKNGKILGFVDKRGRFHELPPANVAWSDPEFHDGYLCVQTGRGYGYYVEDGDQSGFLFYDRAYPFSHGYASYMGFKQPDKKKDPYFNYYPVEGKAVAYELNGKRFDFRDIQFLSSVADDGRALAIIKGKVYWFDAKNGTFSPMYGGGVEDKKNQIEVDDKMLQTIYQPSSKVQFKGKYGKNNLVEFIFDPMLRPDTIILDDRAMTFPKSNADKYTHQSPLTVTSEGGKKGLNYDGKPLIPAQFDEISLVYDDYAIAKSNGKWGILKALPNAQYSFVVNNGKEIGFRHETYDTQIRLDLPKEISSSTVDFDVVPGYGCTLDKRFSDARDTRAGNFLMYNATLQIPENLPSELTDITYPIDITYNDLRLFQYPLKVKGWHLKSYNVNIDEEEITVKDGRATFTVDIEFQRNIGESDYPFTVKSRSDSLYVSTEKISESRYKYTVDALHNGVNHIDIIVTEKGCPSSVFPVEINYVKPTKKNKEAIEIKKKDESVQQNNGDDAPAEETAPAAEPVEAPAVQSQPAVQAAPAAPANNTPAQQPQQSSERYVPSQPETTPTVNDVPKPDTTPTQPQQQSTPNDSIKDANLMRFIKVM